jgi:hypothetical protein
MFLKPFFIALTGTGYGIEQKKKPHKAAQFIRSPKEKLAPLQNNGHKKLSIRKQVGETLS